MSQRAYLIKNKLSKAGVSARLADKDFVSLPFYCTLQQTWRKNKSNFEDIHTPIGTVSNDYYLFIGPFDCDITALSDEGRLIVDSEEYTFLKKERVRMSDSVIYYTGVVKKISGQKNEEAK